MTDLTICHVQGDTFDKSITIESNGAPINLTGSTFAFSIKRKVSDTAYVAQVTPTITNAAAGQIQITVPASSLNVAEGNYFYDLQWTNSSGKIKTILRGILAISYQITKA